jgi:predicted DNA-binding transcriptional regulator YafY
MAQTTERVLHLLGLLQQRPVWTGPELAERLGVTTRSIRRDVERLRRLGYPVQAAQGVGGGYQLGRGRGLPPLLLDDSEAVAVAVSLRMAAGGTVSGASEAALRTLAKLDQVMPPRLRSEVRAIHQATQTLESGPATIDGDGLLRLARAVRDTVRVRFDYESRDKTRTSRTVEPVGLVATGRCWYLMAYDLDREDWRSFRLDRLRDPRPTGARFAPRTLPGGDAAEFVRTGITSRLPSHSVDAVVQAPADDVRARIGQWSTVEAAGPASCRVHMEADDLSWPALALGTVGAEFTVVSPPELRSLLGEWSGRFSRAAAEEPRSA